MEKELGRQNRFACGRGKAALLFKSIPAQLEKNASRYQVSSVLENFKLFVCDTGLFTTMLFMDKDVLSLPVYMTVFL